MTKASPAVNARTQPLTWTAALNLPNGAWSSSAMDEPDENSPGIPPRRISQVTAAAIPSPRTAAMAASVRLSTRN